MTRRKTAQIEKLIENYVNKLHKTNIGLPLPSGYNPIEKIRGGLFFWVAVPFNGVSVYCQLRCPNATQIEQCGDISNITLDNQNDKLNYDDIITIRNYHEALCKLVFNIPTFDNIAQLVGVSDFVISEKKKELNEINIKYEKNKDILKDTQKEAISLQIRTLELQLGYILPDDTMAFITKWAMGNDVSDIKKINKETFLRAAALAERHHKAPSDYISGVLTDFNRNEIDVYAVSVYNQFLEEQKIVRQSKFKWILGGKKSDGSILPAKPGGK
jgi:hypothetical protein